MEQQVSGKDAQALVGSLGPVMARERQGGKNVYQCIAEVQARVARVGIAKDRRNQQQGYAFRGIDDVYNVLAPVLADVGLVILPRMLRRECVERTSKSGTAQFYVVVEAEFDFVSAHDRSQHVVRTFGEAQDSADKATNKAMSAAYKYAAFQTFAIPTEGDNDADATTPEPVRALAPPTAEQEAWLQHMERTAAQGYRAYAAEWRDASDDLRSWSTAHPVAQQRLRAAADAARKVEVVA